MELHENRFVLTVQVYRCRVLVSIMARVTGGGAGVSVDKIVKFSNTVSSEEAQLKFLKNVLGTQVSKRIIFLIINRISLKAI